MYVADSVASIDFAEMACRYWMFDLDGTLAPGMRNDLRLDAVMNIRSAISQGWIDAACVVSNSGLWFMSRRVASLASQCGLPYLSCYWPHALKPSQLAFDTAAGLIAPEGFDPADVMMVGDQLGTDMLAILYGYRTLLVPTLHPIPWWKQRKHDKENRIRQDLDIKFPFEQR